MSLLLSFGRTTFGGPHRAAAGEQGHLHAPLHDGRPAERPVPGGDRRRHRDARDRGPAWCDGGPVWRRGRPRPTGAWPSGWCAAVVGIGVLAPAWSQIDAFGATNAALDRRLSTPPTARQGAQVDRLIAYVRRPRRGTRRTPACPRTGDREFTVGAVPVFKYLESRDVDEVGYTLRTASLMTDPEYYFDEDVPGRLRAVRHPLPDPARGPPGAGPRPPRHAGGARTGLLVLPDRRLRPRGRHRGVAQRRQDQRRRHERALPPLRPPRRRVATWRSPTAGSAPAPLTAPDAVGHRRAAPARCAPSTTTSPTAASSATVVVRRDRGGGPERLVRPRMDRARRRPSGSGRDARSRPAGGDGRARRPHRHLLVRGLRAVPALFGVLVVTVAGARCGRDRSTAGVACDGGRRSLAARRPRAVPGVSATPGGDGAAWPGTWRGRPRPGGRRGSRRDRSSRPGRR